MCAVCLLPSAHPSFYATERYTKIKSVVSCQGDSSSTASENEVKSVSKGFLSLEFN